jgi:hypothetical protein
MSPIPMTSQFSISEVKHMEVGSVRPTLRKGAKDGAPEQLWGGGE